MCHGMDDFPIWVQLLAKVLFTVTVAREGVDYISKESLKQFYEKFAGLTGEDLARTTEEGFKTATAVSEFLLCLKNILTDKSFQNEDYKLDYKSYKLLFSNFLLGKTIYGPGKYLFGVFDNRDSTEQYKVITTATE